MPPVSLPWSWPGWACGSARAKDEREFLAGYARSLPAEPSLKARPCFDNPAVRKLIYALEVGPMKQKDVSAAMKGTAVTPEQLLRVHILRREGETCCIGFDYFYRKDVRRIHGVAEKYVPSLVAACLHKRRQFAELRTGCPAAAVPEDALAFVLTAGRSIPKPGRSIKFLIPG